MNKTRRQIAREKATIAIYQNLLVETEVEEMFDFVNQEKEIAEDDAVEFARWLIQTVMTNKDSYIELINKHLKSGWTFDRLGKMEQAIMLIGTCELLESDLPKTIAINEAILHAKEFCDDDSYKFINGVLAKLV